MKKHIKKSYFIIILALLIGAPVVTNATLMNYGFRSPNFTVKEYDYNNTWQTPMNQSISNWNSTATRVWITKSSSSANTIVAAGYSDTWYGLATQTVSGNTTTKFQIKLNSTTISNDATNFNNFVQSVLVHELGHILWLADNPSTTSSSIMKYSRDRNTLTRPQTYDINDVNTKFP